MQPPAELDASGNPLGGPPSELDEGGNPVGVLRTKPTGTPEQITAALRQQRLTGTNVSATPRIDALNEALEPMAHPKTAGDIVNLLIPDAAGPAGIWRGFKQYVAPYTTTPIAEGAARYGGALANAAGAASSLLLPEWAMKSGRIAFKTLSELNPAEWNSPLTVAGRAGRAQDKIKAFNELPLIQQQRQIPNVAPLPDSRGPGPVHQTPPSLTLHKGEPAQFTTRPPHDAVPFNDLPLAVQMERLPQGAQGARVGPVRQGTPPYQPPPVEPPRFSERSLYDQMMDLPVDVPAPVPARGSMPPHQPQVEPVPFHERPLAEQMSDLPTTGPTPEGRASGPPLRDEPTPFHQRPLIDQMQDLIDAPGGAIQPSRQPITTPPTRPGDIAADEAAAREAVQASQAAKAADERAARKALEDSPQVAAQKAADEAAARTALEDSPEVAAQKAADEAAAREVTDRRKDLQDLQNEREGVPYQPDESVEPDAPRYTEPPPAEPEPDAAAAGQAEYDAYQQAFEEQANAARKRALEEAMTEGDEAAPPETPEPPPPDEPPAEPPAPTEPAPGRRPNREGPTPGLRLTPEQRERIRQAMADIHGETDSSRDVMRQLGLENTPENKKYVQQVIEEVTGKKPGEVTDKVRARVDKHASQFDLSNIDAAITAAGKNKAAVAALERRKAMLTAMESSGVNAVEEAINKVQEPIERMQGENPPIIDDAGGTDWTPETDTRGYTGETSPALEAFHKNLQDKIKRGGK